MAASYKQYDQLTEPMGHGKHYTTHGYMRTDSSRDVLGTCFMEEKDDNTGWQCPDRDFTSEKGDDHDAIIVHSCCLRSSANGN